MVEISAESPRSAAISLTGRLGFHSRRPSKPPSRNVEHDRGEPPGSTALAARRAGYPWTEQMDRKMLRNVEIRGVHAAGNGPSSDRKYWQRLELGIHSLNRWTVKCLEMSRKHGVQTAGNGTRSPPTPAGGPVAKPEMSTADRLGSRERARGHLREGPPTFWRQCQLLQDPLSPVLDGRLVEIRKKPVQGRSLYTKGRHR